MTRTLTAILLILLTAGTALSAEHARKGLNLGFNAGCANSVLEYDRLGATVDRESDGGFGGAARIGYGVSDSVILSLDLRGFNKEDGPQEIHAALALATITWHPGGGGFFLRAGVGGGSADVLLPAPDNADWNDREGDAALIGLGYEWRLGRQFALGLALDGYGLHFDDRLGFQDTTLGFGSTSLQFQWYL